MSIAWTEHHRCPHCAAGAGSHYEFCPDFKPDYERDGLYRLTKACPNCSVPESKQCGRCHHPKGLHHNGKLCAQFLTCQCEYYEPIECQFHCRDGRIVPERVKYMIRWHFGLMSRPMFDSEIEDLVFALDKEMPLHYPVFPDYSKHYDHVHVEMRPGALDEPETEIDP